MEPYIGEIRMFAGTFAPVGWALCDGSSLLISEYEPLFSLLGTTYGGDGQTTFALPDLRGRIPIHAGQNPTTGTPYRLGQAAGVETITLTSQQMPSHTHMVAATSTRGTQQDPTSGLWATSSLNAYSAQTSPNTPMASDAVSPAGSSQAHANMMPFQCVHFIIATEGIFPPQN